MSELSASSGRRNWRKKLLSRIVLYPIASYVIWCGILVGLQDRIIFPRSSAYVGDPTPNDIEILTIQIEDGGSVGAWLVPATNTRANLPGPAVVFFHGNAAVMEQGIDLARRYNQMGCSVLLPEYRGYGRAAGRPSQDGIVSDAVRFYELLAARPDIDADRIVFHGRSLGGGASAALAARRKPAALILESTFSSVVSLAGDLLVPSFLVRHPFRTDRVVRNIDIPLLIFHGSEDIVIPVAEGRLLNELAPSAVYVEYEAGHSISAVPSLRDSYWNEIDKHLRAANVTNGVYSRQ